MRSLINAGFPIMTCQDYITAINLISRQTTLQNKGYRDFFKNSSIPILELPTGQGVVIIP